VRLGQLLRLALLWLLLSAAFVPGRTLAADDAVEAFAEYRFVYYDNTLSHYATASLVSLPYSILTHALEGAHQSSRNLEIIESTLFVDLMRGFFVELPLVSYGFTIQHELGHGFRARDLGLRPRYSFGLPLPYSQMSEGQERLGYTDFQSTKLLTGEEQLLFEIGGLEANVVHTKYLSDIAVTSGGLSRPDLNLYFFSKLATPLYGLYRKKGANDVEGVTWQKDVRTKGLLNLIDPFAWQFFAANFYYYTTGRHQKHVPWFEVTGDIRIVPQARFYLLPSGEAYEANVLSQLWNSFYNVTLSWWRFADPRVGAALTRDAYRFGLQALRYEIHRSVFLTGQIDISRQSYFATDRWDRDKSVVAAGVGLEGRLRDGAGCSISVIRKDKGYFPEMTIHEGYVWKAGLSYPLL